MSSKYPVAGMHIRQTIDVCVCVYCWVWSHISLFLYLFVSIHTVFCHVRICSCYVNQG